MKSATRESYQERILRVLVHIQAHLDDALSLEDLARLAAFSPYHFHRIFRGMVGEAVKEHVRRLRLERAAHYLRRSTRPVIDVALDAGYETHESFTRAFGAMFGQSPSRFRESRSVIGYQEAPSGVHFAPNGNLNGARLSRGSTPPLSVQTVKLGPMRVAFLRHIGPYEEVGGTWMRLMAWAGQRGLLATFRGMLGIVHDDPEVTPAEKLRYDAALIVPDGTKAEGKVGITVVGPGEFAVTTHKGPYEQLGATYARLCGGWLPSSARELESAPALEFYRNSPPATPPAELLTDIYLPLES